MKRTGIIIKKKLIQYNRYHLHLWRHGNLINTYKQGCDRAQPWQATQYKEAIAGEMVTINKEMPTRLGISKGHTTVNIEPQTYVKERGPTERNSKGRREVNKERERAGRKIKLYIYNREENQCNSGPKVIWRNSHYIQACMQRPRIHPKNSDRRRNANPI